MPVEYLSHADKYAAELKKASLLVQILKNPVPEGGSEKLRSLKCFDLIFLFMKCLLLLNIVL